MLEEVLFPIGMLAAVVGIVWLRTRVNQTRLAKNAETLQQLLAKFESGRELAEFMETDGGGQFMRQFEPNTNMLGTLATGIVFTSLGLGMFWLMTRLSEFLYPAVISLALGIGLIAAALVAKRVAEKWQATA